jgi:hypothetical protein
MPWIIERQHGHCPPKGGYHFRSGSNRVTLTLCRSVLVLAYKQTFQDSVRISQKCQEESVPLPRTRN